MLQQKATSNISGAWDEDYEDAVLPLLNDKEVSVCVAVG